MLITDYFFLVYFFPIFLLIYFFVRKSTLLSNLLVIVASLLYYASFRTDHLWVLILPLFVDYIVALLIFYLPFPKARKTLLGSALIFSLGLLVYYKYTFLGLTTVRAIFNKPFFLSSFAQLVMPVGISFITFQRMSYLIDVYRGKVKPTFSLIKYFVYAAFFAQLLAGPIVRFNEVKDQLGQRKLNFGLWFEGIKYLTFGMVSKILIADQLFNLENRLTTQLTDLNLLTSTILIIYFAFRIYFDFMGYSLMAIGLAKFVGFHFPDNFDSPYRATGFRDFWRRWNITLSKWFQDYLYIPLGGSRKGFVRTQVNLLITMLLVGFWHGASWSFMVWGGIHGSLMVLERLSSKFLKISLPTITKQAITLVVVTLAWIPFKFSDWPNLSIYLQNLSKLSFNFTDRFTLNLFLATVPSLLMAIGWSFYFSEKNIVKIKPSFIKTVAFCLLFFFTLGYSLIITKVPFIYFQF